jgi:hypothetical protein
MTTRYEWHSLDIGYQAKATNTEICKLGAKKPDALVALEKTFNKDLRQKMHDGGHVDLPIGPDVEDAEWVPCALMTLLNEYLATSGLQDRITIHAHADFLRLLGPERQVTGVIAMAKGIDTRCVLRGGQWYSIRSYRICRAEAPSQPWFPAPSSEVPDISASADCLVATLTWLCQSVDA